MGLFAALNHNQNNNRDHWRGHPVISSQDIVENVTVPTAASASSSQEQNDDDVVPPQQPAPANKPWIRGVNLGGFIMMERYITPYQFAVTDCHLQGDFCWYPGQINAPPSHHADGEPCDLYTCTPILTTNVFGQDDFPLDEYHLASAFLEYNRADAANHEGGVNPGIAYAEQWLQHHLDNFIVKDDIKKLARTGVTHLRVPLPHWILHDQDEILEKGDVWIVGQRWQAFAQLVHWAREYHIEIWPDIHSAPGSQNGFDNSGVQYKDITGTRWSSNPDHVQESLDVIQKVTARMVQEGMQDVVTGFGLLNEPFKDTHRGVYLDFIEAGLKIVRRTLGAETYVYVSDLFSPQSFNNGHWWMDAERHDKTFLDTHYYHVFAQTTRDISPRQHVALTCQNEYHRHSKVQKDIEGGVTSCCWRDAPRNTVPSRTGGVSRMVGEWSAAVDVLPVDRLYQVMQGIAQNGTAPLLHRQLSPARQDFLRNFVTAQMVTYEAADKGIASAWFYWTVKMEGGAFAEWDFMRGLEEGWIPSPLPGPDTASVDVFGTCYDIIFRTNDDLSIIDEFPDPATLNDANNWQGVPIDDDVVLSHGQSLIKPANTVDDDDHEYLLPPVNQNVPTHSHNWFLSTTSTFLAIALVSLGLIASYRWQQQRRRRKADHHQYEPIGAAAAVAYPSDGITPIKL